MQIKIGRLNVGALCRAVLVGAAVLLVSAACASDTSEVGSPSGAQDDVAALQARLDTLEERLAEQPSGVSSDAAQSMMDEMRGAANSMGMLMEEMGPENIDPATMGRMQSMMGQMVEMSQQMGAMMGSKGMGDMMSDGQSMQDMMDHMHAMHGDLDEHADEGHMHYMP